MNVDGGKGTFRKAMKRKKGGLGQSWGPVWPEDSGVGRMRVRMKARDMGEPENTGIRGTITLQWLMLDQSAKRRASQRAWWNWRLVTKGSLSPQT